MSDYPLGQKLWRCMSFSRFMWLLQRKLLWIGRSDTLNDPWELAINPTYLAETLARGPITPIGQDRNLRENSALWPMAKQGGDG
jgi:hypothetical protein